MKKEVNNLKVNQKGYIERFEERNGKEDESNCYNLKNKTNKPEQRITQKLLTVITYVLKFNILTVFQKL